MKLECWLPEKEMFGKFSLDSITARGDKLTVVASNEVLEFTILFDGGVGAYRVAERARSIDRIEKLRAEYGVSMRGTTFFKLTGSRFAQRFGAPGDKHYFIAAPNYTVDILARKEPAVALDMSPARR